MSSKSSTDSSSSTGFTVSEALNDAPDADLEDFGVPTITIIEDNPNTSTVPVNKTNNPLAAAIANAWPLYKDGKLKIHARAESYNASIGFGLVGLAGLGVGVYGFTAGKNKTIGTIGLGVGAIGIGGAVYKLPKQKEDIYCYYIPFNLGENAQDVSGEAQILLPGGYDEGKFIQASFNEFNRQLAEAKKKSVTIEVVTDETKDETKEFEDEIRSINDGQGSSSSLDPSRQEESEEESEEEEKVAESAQFADQMMAEAAQQQSSSSSSSGMANLDSAAKPSLESKSYEDPTPVKVVKAKPAAKPKTSIGGLPSSVASKKETPSGIVVSV